MNAIGYVRVSTEKQADFGVSLEAQQEKVRAMAVVQGAELAEVIIDAGESAKSLNRPGMVKLLAVVDSGAVDTVIIAKLDRLTRSVKDLAELLERFNRSGVSLVSVADALDTRSAAGRLVLNIMVSVSQWEREAIGERTRDAMSHKRANGERVGTEPFGYDPPRRSGYTSLRHGSWAMARLRSAETCAGHVRASPHEETEPSPSLCNRNLGRDRTGGSHRIP